jgi:hypothetical protein
MEKWSLVPGFIRNIVQRRRSLSKLAQDGLVHLAAAEQANSSEASRVRAATTMHRRETRALKIVLAGTLSKLAE